MLKLLAFVLGVVGFGLPAATAEEMSEELRGFIEDCRQGSANSCLNAAAIFEDGKDVSFVLEFYELAKQLYEKACDSKDDAEACFYAGWTYERVGETRDDEDLALHFYFIACEMGYTDGCYFYGVRKQ